jgi:hypothetical protein
LAEQYLVHIYIFIYIFIFQLTHRKCDRASGQHQPFASRGMILTVADWARLPIMGSR